MDATALPSADTLAEAETLEWIERRAAQSLLCSAPREVREQLGLKVFEAGPLLGAFASRLDVPGLNRVLGLGQPPDSFAAVETALALSRRSAAARVLLPVLPGPVGARVEARLADQGLRPHGGRLRLSLRLDPPFHAGYPGAREGRPAVRRLGRQDAAAFGVLAAGAFGMPLAAAGLLAGAVGAPGWIHLGAWREGILAGVAAAYREGSACWLGLGAVREGFRGRGLHAALIGERLRAAREEGAAVVTAETCEGEGGRPSLSTRNLLRFGFEMRYLRTDWLSHPRASGL